MAPCKRLNRGTRLGVDLHANLNTKHDETDSAG